MNDLTSVTERFIAFTQNQRYASLARLKAAKRTSELCDLEAAVARDQ
jgi:predicted negative regulator of RcsB-dependent stress response